MLDDLLEILMPILCSVVAGGVLGIDREMRARPAGFRTHILVCLASAALMLAPAHQDLWAASELSESFRTDPTRMGQGIMTGIGFLGAGVIFRHGLTIHGLTTAATLWVTAGIGILFGLGFYIAGWLSTGAAAVVLMGLHWVDEHLPGDSLVDIVLRYPAESAPDLDAVEAMLKADHCDAQVTALRLTDGGATIEHELLVSSRKTVKVRGLAERLRTLEGLTGLELRPR
jgi:putative Mg2+ transporter-C (MgtC) family protein